jgi:hypothetical protein
MLYHLPGHITCLINPDGLGSLLNIMEGMREVVEIGSWKGGSTYLFCSFCAGPVYAVDHWLGSPDKDDATHFEARQKDVFAIFKRNVGHFPNLNILKMDSVAASTMFPDKSVDMVFVDAGHDAASVTADIAAWFPKCRKVLCGHDESHAPVRLAIESLGRTIRVDPGDIWSIRCDD